MIAVMGDSHGNILPTVRGIQAGAALLPPQDGIAKVLLHLGDFGFYPSMHYIRYLSEVSRALTDVNAVMFVLDGNHENHELLAGVAASARDHGQGPPYMVAPRVYWLPRGCRWQWAGRTWVAAGGGVSVNRVHLVEGIDWFPEEALSPADVKAITDPGPADVIVSHDVPSGVHLSLPPPDPSWDLADLARADAHRDILQDIGTRLRPRYWMHGHMHMGYQRDTDIGWGPLQVTGLERSGTPLRPAPLHTAVLDLASMAWTPYQADLSRDRPH